ncbi:MAG: formate dehydrogenase accessory sulfurtransferase FdhD [Bacteroidia bacterium]
MKPSVAAVNIVKVSANKSEKMADLTSVEEPLEMRISYGNLQNRKKKSISVTMRTPGNDFELAIGFLFTEGIIATQKAIKNIRYCTEPESELAVDNIVIVELEPNVSVDIKKLERMFYTTSSCGVCGKASIEAVQNANCPVITKDKNLIKPELVFDLPIRLREKQAVFEHTGGLHGCALFNFDGNLQLLREDVGRHNALDKLLGAAISNTTFNIEKSILQLSGRVSFELVQKAAMAAIPIITAVGAPSSLAVQSAQELGITLIGFLREKHFNIYTHPDRIDLN